MLSAHSKNRKHLKRNLRMNRNVSEANSRGGSGMVSHIGVLLSVGMRGEAPPRSMSGKGKRFSVNCVMGRGSPSVRKVHQESGTPKPIHLASGQCKAGLLTLRTGSVKASLS